MKRAMFRFMSLFAVATMFVACSKNDSYSDGLTIWQGLGDIVKNENHTYTIIDDDADTILITNASAFDSEVGDRVSFSGEIISKNSDGENLFYEFRALDMNEILVKDIINQSNLDSDEALADEVGYDNIFLYEAKNNSKYLNLSFFVYANDPSIKHTINLVRDDSKPLSLDADGTITLYLELAHNNNGDLERTRSHGLVSFNLTPYTEIDGVNVKKINFNISYKESVNKTSTLTYVSNLE